MSARRIAVIGAGLASLACARALHEAGRAVTLFDRHTEPGGRCATLRTPAGPCDHGLPALTAITPEFQAQLGRWAEAGWIAPDDRAPGHWIGTPTMQSLPQRLAEGLMFAGGLEVAALERDGTHWLLRTHQTPPLGLDLRFDAVVVAMPAEQALPLLGAAPVLAEALRSVRTEPCWSVVAAWPVALPLRTDELRGSDEVLHSARRDDHRPGRGRSGTRWVLQAGAYWSANNLDVRPQDVGQRLLDAFVRAAGVRLARPSYLSAHLWRQARVAEPLAQPYGWSDEWQVGTCGDAWHALEGVDGAERAWLSAQALAAHLAARR